MNTEKILEISGLVCHVDDDGIFGTTVLERDSNKPLGEVLAVFDGLLVAPPIRRDFGHSGDKAQMVAVHRLVPSVADIEFGIIIHFEAISIRYELFGPGIPRSFGRANASDLREALRILASGASPLAYLQKHGEFELNKD